jgi:hypothetical protein
MRASLMKNGELPLKRVVLCGDHHQNSPIIQNMAFRQYAHFEQSLLVLGGSFDHWKISELLVSPAEELCNARSCASLLMLCGDHHQNSPIIQNMAFRQYAHFEQSLFLRLARWGSFDHWKISELLVSPAEELCNARSCASLLIQVAVVITTRTHPSSRTWPSVNMPTSNKVSSCDWRGWVSQ